MVSFRLYIHYFVALFAIATPSLLCSCQDFTEERNALNANNGAQSYFNLMIEVGDSDDGEGTRSSNADAPGPDGGSDGDGNEVGYENEYKVDNITLMIFEKRGKSTSIGDPAKILDSFYFSSFEFLSEESKDKKNKYYQSKETFKLDPKYANGEYYFLIIANAGDVRSKYRDMTSVEIVDDIVQGGWTDEEGKIGVSGIPTDNDKISKYSKFLMTNDQLHRISSSLLDPEDHKGTIDDPHVLTEKIHRMAARIDFHVLKGQNNYKKYTDDYSGILYDAVDKNGNADGKFLLTHVLPFNCFKEGTYFTEHVITPDENIRSPKDFLIDKMSQGKEYKLTETYNGVLTDFKYCLNWVIDPWSEVTADGQTYVSHEDNHTSDMYTNYLDKTIVNSVDLISHPWTYSWDNYKVREAKLEFQNEEGKFYILTYTNENTSICKNSYDYATGLIFRGRYFTNDEWNNGSPANGAGQDIAYKYYIRHSDPYDVFNTTGNPDEDAINNMTIKGTDYKNAMLFATVRNNIYRVSIGKVIAPEKEDEEPKLKIVLKVKPWTRYEHAEIDM